MPHEDAVFNEIVAAQAVRPPRQNCERTGIAGGQVPSSGRRHDRSQTFRPSGMVDRHQLGDHAAHRGADNVGAADAERVHEADRIVGHVIERIGNVRYLPGGDLRQQRARLGRRPAREVGRLTDVAVVEPHDAESPGRQAFAQRLWPENELGRQAHDHENERIAVTAEGLVFDIDSVRSCLRHGSLGSLQ